MSSTVEPSDRSVAGQSTTSPTVVRVPKDSFFAPSNEENVTLNQEGDWIPVRESIRKAANALANGSWAQDVTTSDTVLIDEMLATYPLCDRMESLMAERTSMLQNTPSLRAISQGKNLTQQHAKTAMARATKYLYEACNELRKHRLKPLVTEISLAAPPRLAGTSRSLPVSSGPSGRTYGRISSASSQEEAKADEAYQKVLKRLDKLEGSYGEWMDLVLQTKSDLGKEHFKVEEEED